MELSKKIAISLGSLGILAGAVGTIALQTHAADTTATATATQTLGSMGRGFKNFTPPAAAGAVTAVSGNTITLTDKKTGTAYTVDASSATIEKFSAPASGAQPTIPPTPTTISVSDIAVGDSLMVEGTVSGTNIKATKIVDGMFMGHGGFGDRGSHGTMGTVSSVSGTSITLTGKDGTTYTIDAGSAAIKKISTASVSDISVGDTLTVEGTKSGNSVIATQVLDGVWSQK